MDLAVIELITDLYQSITMTKNVNLTNVRMHLLKHGAPAGSLKVQILDTNGFLIEESNVVTIASITAATGAYFHGQVRFDISTPLMSGQTYRINLVGVGYTFSETDYIAVNNDLNFAKVTKDYIPTESFDYALDMELWERKRD